MWSIQPMFLELFKLTSFLVRLIVSYPILQSSTVWVSARTVSSILIPFEFQITCWSPDSPTRIAQNAGNRRISKPPLKTFQADCQNVSKEALLPPLRLHLFIWTKSKLSTLGPVREAYPRAYALKAGSNKINSLQSAARPLEG